jgi:hypothetical protein
LVLSLGGAAFAAAPGDVIGLADFNANREAGTAIRDNTYTADHNTGDTFELLIVQVIQGPTSGDTFLAGFPTSDDAASITWSQNTPGMENGYIDESTVQAVLSPIGGWALRVQTYDMAGSLGPDSWRAADGDGNTGDFSFVGTDYTDPDSGTVDYPINVKYYDGNPTTMTPFASGTFVGVNGYDDYDSAELFGDHGRSYPTALDALAHGTVSSPPTINTYHKYHSTQDLRDIVDLNNITHPLVGNDGWLYAVYYLNGNQFVRDPLSEIIGYDDYKFRDGEMTALVQFAIGIYDKNLYASYFPDTLK